MKKIILGVKYDTTTAKKICEDVYQNCFRDDPEFFSETLYQKKNGEFFLYLAGGAESVYRKSNGDAFVAGEEIIPLDEEGAKSFAQENLDGDSYEALFGEVSEDPVEVTE